MRAVFDRPQDPRYYQIATLGGLLAYGIWSLDFEVSIGRAILIIASALASQLALTKWLGLSGYDPKSPLISALSLCLLLRTNYAALAVATAVVTIASKFVLRIEDRHVFNPTNFGLVLAMLVTGQVWVSPGQWGSGAIFLFLMASVGGIVIYRAARSDVTLAFVAFYAAILFLRAFWLGDPIAVPLHQLESGSFLLFAFFMLSDPKTTPDSRAGRVVYAALVALGGAYVQFVLFQPHGLLYSLVLCGAVTPAINRFLPGERYQWEPADSPMLPISIPVDGLSTPMPPGPTPAVERSYA